MAQVTSCTRREIPLTQGEDRFVITHSGATGGGHTVLVSPDVATCPHCLADMNDPTNRRYQYPFTNCTDCGPRYTITRSIPYDRRGTSMSCFPLCPDCQAEYDNPHDRRFHAQPNACPVCGPHVWLTDGQNEQTGQQGQGGQRAIEQTAAALAAGKIVAIKGLGGFHLVCDATNAEAIATLRRRKHRPHKALAVMVPDMDTVHRIAQVAPLEARTLTSSERPIVVLTARPEVLPPSIAPDLASVGVMLPYTPLHHLLLQAFGRLRLLPVLVMTSGNAGGEPIALGNREALVRLRDQADLFLLHNRDILIRADDSVVCAPFAPADEQVHVFRRARGYVPRPLRLPEREGHTPCILATGAELKNTLCLTRTNDAFVSQHIGDLKNLETFGFFQDMATHLSTLLEVTPEVVVCDLHPDYLSTTYAQEYAAAKKIPLLRIQHHFAHIYSVLGEHNHLAPALGLALDGTGYGTDGTIWGGELLLVRPDAPVSPKTFGQSTPWGERLGRLTPFPLPGGEAAIREPWRLVSGFLALPECAEAMSLNADASLALLQTCFTDTPPPHLSAHHAAIAELVRCARTPRTSSCGRLFDAVAALLGLCPNISYEGQAA
ncbi:MAG: carbamoyltransferase HypF, partial [Bilophila sp.]